MISWSGAGKLCRENGKALTRPTRMEYNSGMGKTREEQGVYRRRANWLVFISLLVLLASAGCGGPGTSPTTRSVAQTGNSAAGAGTPSSVTNESTASFTLSGGQNASYTLHTDLTASELRHGHREFTINVISTGISLFIVFYGYQGPGNYTLSSYLNGGDVHIGLQNDEFSWDLLMQPEAQCNLTVESETPANSAGLARMKGSFACPHLLSSAPAHPQRPIAVKNGSFDIAILVAS